MKKHSKTVQESLAAIPSVTNGGDMRRGLASAMLAVRRGDITAEEGKAIVIAVKKQRRKRNSAE